MAYGSLITAPVVTGSHDDMQVVLVAGSFKLEAIDGGATSILNGGGNLRAYTDITKETRLPLEVIRFVTGVSPDIYVEILEPNLITGTQIYIVADDVETTQPPVTSTYGRNLAHFNMEFVSHDGVTDSTGNYPDPFALVGPPTVTDGPFLTNTAYMFNGANDWIDVDVSSRDPIEAMLGTESITLMVWANSVTNVLNQRAITMHGSTTSYAALGFNYGGTGGTNFFIGAKDSNATDLARVGAVDPSVAGFYGGSMSLDAVTSPPVLVANGVELTVTTAPNLGDGAVTRALRLGARNDNLNDFQGVGSSFAYGKFESSADRLKTWQDNRLNADTWWAVGDWVESITPPTPAYKSFWQQTSGIIS